MALAITALLLAITGVLLTFVPASDGTLSAGWLCFLLLAAAFIVSLVSLISRNQGGKGVAIGALATSVLGGVLAIALTVAWAFGSFVSPGGVDVGPAPGDGYGNEHEDPAPGVAAPGTDGNPVPGTALVPPVQAAVTETAFGRGDDGLWWYAAVVDNTNADYVFDNASLQIHAYAADGSVIGSATDWAILLQGESIIVGRFFDVGDAEIARIGVDVPEASFATLAPAAETGSFQTAVSGASSSGGATSVSGTVTGRFADDQPYIAVGVLARDPQGQIVAATETYIDTVPSDGTAMPFEAWFLDELSADVVFEASATRR